MMLTVKQALELISVGGAFVSGLTLFWAGLGVPDDEKSWKGQTPREVAVRKRQTIMKWVGIPAAIVALIAQVIVILKF